MWYAASLFFRGVHTPPKKDPKWEESIRLIDAVSEEDARIKASRIGQTEEHSYQTQDGHHLSWKFERVERVYAIDQAKILDGTELFSRFLRESEALSLLTPFEDD